MMGLSRWRVRAVLAGDNGLHHADGLFQVAQGQGESQLVEVRVAHSLEEPPAGHPAHLIVEAGPFNAPAAHAEANKFADLGVKGI